jgi:predicted TIM-barrel fold metal-dependent hydrolase
MDRGRIQRATIVPWLPAQDLVRAAVETGIDRDRAAAAVIDEWRELNTWATDTVAAHPDRLTCLVGVDPVLMPEDVVIEEVRSQLARGASGLKIAPMFFDARPDDEAVEVVWRLAAEHGVYVLSACGSAAVLDHEPCGRPEYFEAVLRSYPTVLVQLAQLGQAASAGVASLTARFSNVMTDTALRLGKGESPQDLAALIRSIGVDRVMFGTNYPLVDPSEYAAVMRALPLSDEELRQVGARNADRLHAGRLRR